jgi:hypothetical protein
MVSWSTNLTDPSSRRGIAHLKKLGIGHANISSGSLGTMIRILKCLEELPISLGGLWQTDGVGL